MSNKTKDRTKGEWKLNCQPTWPFHMDIESEDGNKLIAHLTMAHYSTADKSIKDCLKRDPEANREAIANAEFIVTACNSHEKLIEALKEALAEQESTVNAINKEADWHNNNVEGVGQTIDYKSGAQLPEWALKAKQLLESLT